MAEAVPHAVSNVTIALISATAALVERSSVAPSQHWLLYGQTNWLHVHLLSRSVL